MKAFKNWLLPCLLIVSFISSSCEDENDELQVQIELLEIEMVALDDNGNEGTMFTAGTDISLALKITNNSAEDFLWRIENDCVLLSLDDFYNLYLFKEENQDANGEFVNVGKPYDPIAGCLGVYVSPRENPPGITIFLKETWSNNHTVPLSAGRYFSEFTHNLRVDNDHTLPLNLRVEFQIE